MTARAIGLVLVLGLAGCASRADLMRQDRQLRGLVQDQRRQLQQMQRELEQLRAAVEGGGGRTTGSKTREDRLAAVEDRLSQIEGGPPAAAAAAVPPAEGEPAAPAAPEKSVPPTREAAVPATPTPAAPPAENPEQEAWRKAVTREQAAAGSVNVPERGEYLGLLDGVARQDCAKQIPLLNGFAASHKESPLADNALYWAGRCYAVRGKQEDAVSKFYEVVTRYPKSDQAAASLWAQGNLFVAMGNTPDARIVFSKLTRDYPASEEAAQARQKLSELEN